MKTTFTAGPWWMGSFEEDGLKQICRGDANGGSMEIIALCNGNNSALIAAAPDMLAALQLAADELQLVSDEQEGRFRGYNG